MIQHLLIFCLLISSYAYGSEFSEGDELESLNYLGQSQLQIQSYIPQIQLSWPVKEPIQFVRGFKRGLKKHKGIDLDGHTGDPIFAAHAGQVVYADNKLRGYGKMVIIEAGQWSTILCSPQRNSCESWG